MISCSERLSFTYMTIKEAESIENFEKYTCIRLILDQAIDPDHDLRSFHLLKSMLSGAKMVRQALEDNPAAKVLICQQTENAKEIRESALLFGGYLILAQVMSQEQVVQLFDEFAHQPLSNASDSHIVTISDCWQALQHVSDIGWMNWKDGTDEEDQPFLVDEFVHYADMANGGVYIVAPEQLMLFSDPVDLPDHQQWISVVGDDERCTRRFSPAFYADLFADLGVAAVACLTESGSSGAAFAARGIEARDLGPGGSASLLRSVDGLLSLSRGAAPGAVAVHGGGGGRWPEWAGVTVAAWLVSRAGFEERGAYGWLHMLCPWLLRGPPPLPAEAV